MIDAFPMSLSHLLDTNLINDALNSMGMSITWYPSRRCECWGQIDGTQQSSGSPDPSCTTCGGSGRLYPNGYNITGVVLDGMQNVASWNADSGVNYIGTIRMLVPAIINNQSCPLYLGGTLDDLILAQDIVLTTRTLIKRGVDQLRESPITPVTITYGATVYQQGTDYRINKRVITWLSSGPPTGDEYEASYGFQPWFNIVQGMAIARNLSHLNLPRTFTLQLNPDLGEVFPND